jgi:hypothetical protein
MSTPKVKFIESTHQYLTEDDTELISVSAFTERFKPKVDWKAVAKKVAAKKTKEGEPTTTEEILAKWERKRDLAAQIGTAYHNTRESELLAQNKPEFYGVSCETEQCEHTGGYKYSIPINKLNNNTVYPELMIYDFDYMICGQSDKVIVTNKKINIWDYKTDQEIKFKAFSSKWVEPAKLLGPLSHLDDCNANVYSIKMSLYMYLLWKSNRGSLKPGDIIIEHVHLLRDPDNDNLPVLRNGKPVVQKIEQIKLPYRKKEVEAMLATIKH